MRHVRTYCSRPHVCTVSPARQWGSKAQSSSVQRRNCRHPGNLLPLVERSGRASTERNRLRCNRATAHRRRRCDPADPFDLIVCSPSRLAKYYRGEAWDGYEVLPGGTVLPITGVWRMKSWSRVDFEAALQRVPTKRCGSGPIRRGLCGAGGPAGGCDRQSDEQEGHNNRPHSRREACETPQAG